MSQYLQKYYKTLLVSKYYNQRDRFQMTRLLLADPKLAHGGHTRGVVDCCDARDCCVLWWSGEIHVLEFTSSRPSQSSELSPNASGIGNYSGSLLDMSSRPTANPANAKFSFSALQVEGGDDDAHSDSEGELVEAPLTPPPPVVSK